MEGERSGGREEWRERGVEGGRSGGREEWREGGVEGGVEGGRSGGRKGFYDPSPPCRNYRVRSQSWKRQFKRLTLFKLALRLNCWRR